MATFDAEDEFRAKVAAQLGKGRIAESIWEWAYDSALIYRYEDAAQRLRGELPKVAAAQAREEQNEAIEEQARVVAALYDFVVEAASDLHNEGAPIGLPTPRKQARSSKDARDALQTEHSGELWAELSDYERDRAWALTRELASIADGVYGSRIQQFRKNQLDGAPLVAEAVERWNRSPLTRLLNRAVLRQMRWHPLTQPATSQPPERFRDERGHQYEQIMLTVTDEPFPVKRHLREPVSLLTLPSGDRVEFWKWSLGDELMKLATRLSRSVPWSADEAAWFVLTNEAPAVSPLKGTFERRTLRPYWQSATLNIEVEPWVSTDTLVKLYQEARRRVMPRTSRPRPSGLAVWRFVEGQHAASGPTLRDIHRQLITLHPGRSYPPRMLWSHWQSAHPDIRSLTLNEVGQRWNDVHPTASLSYSQFRKALLSGLEHADLIAFPGYQMLASDEATGDGSPLPPSS